MKKTRNKNIYVVVDIDIDIDIDVDRQMISGGPSGGRVEMNNQPCVYKKILILLKKTRISCRGGIEKKDAGYLKGGCDARKLRTNWKTVE